MNRESVVRSLSVDDFIDLVYGSNIEHKKYTKNLYNYVKNEFFINNIFLKNIVLNFERGTFVAGGFTRWIFFSAKKIDDFYAAYNHRAFPIDHKYEILRHAIQTYLLILQGDIDIFFKNKENFDRTTEDIKKFSQFHSRVFLSSTEFADTYTYHHKVEPFLDSMCSCRREPAPYKIQLVKCDFASQEDMIDRFDITNGMISTDFKNDIVYFHQDLPELEASGTLGFHRQHLDDPFTVQRCYKYITRGDYQRFDKKSNSLNYFARWCHKNLRKDEGNLEKEDRDRIWNQRALLASILRRNNSIVSTHDLVLFHGVVSEDDYTHEIDIHGNSYYHKFKVDTVTQVIKNRAKK